MATAGTDVANDFSQNVNDGNNRVFKERGKQKRGFFSSLFGCFSKSSVKR
jgi:hypothetical protein